MKKMKVFIFLLMASFAVCQAISFAELVQEEWSTFKIEHGKDYQNNVEEKFRMRIFVENKRKIAKHNAKYEMGFVSYKLKLNQFGDLLHHEFIAIFNGFNKSTSGLSSRSVKRAHGGTFIPPANVNIPDSVDWRPEGAVTPVKDQGQCGSCWAFSSTGALEGQHFRKDGILVSLSEQNLVDCSTVYGNNGCGGGLMDDAFQYIRDNNGIDTEQSYPYEAQDDACRFDPNNVGARDAGFIDIPAGDEEALQAAIATIGPIAVAIDASQPSFQFYHEGVYFEPFCSNTQLDHAVLAVGYGNDGNGIGYYIVKNSWASTWGDAGYIKMSRNMGNNCGIASMASYPVV